MKLFSQKNSTLALFAFLSLLSVQEVSAQQNRVYKPRARVTTIERTPQTFVSTKELLESTSKKVGDLEGKFNNDLEELKSQNSSLKKDINVLLQQVNSLSSEIDNLKNKSSENSDFTTFLDKNYQNLLYLLSLMLLVYLMIFLKLKSDSNKNISQNVSEAIKEAKKELFKDFKLTEGDFSSLTEEISKRKINELDIIFGNSYQEFENKIQSLKDNSSNKFSENLDDLIKKRLDNVLTDVNTYLDENKANVLKQLEEKLPKGDLAEVIVAIAEDRGLMKSLAKRIDNNIAELMSNELKKLDKHIIAKEHQIIADIQKLHIANSFFNTGNSFARNKNYEEAIEEFKKAIKVDPNFYGAYINMGKAYENKQDFENAISSYRTASEIETDHYKSYYNLGCLFLKLEMYDKAEDILNIAKNLSPDNEKIHYRLGNAYKALNDKDKAIECYEKAIELKVDMTEAYVSLIKLENPELKDYTEIIKSLSERFYTSEDTQKQIKNLL